MEILDGKQTAQNITDEIKEQLVAYAKVGKRMPRLDIFLVGDDFGSQKYVEMKRKKAEELGINAVVHIYSADTSEEDLLTQIKGLNEDDVVDGLMVQLPLPSTINQNKVLESILPSKDVDGLTSTNLGKLFKNDVSAIAPATPKGIIELLKAYGVEVEGKNAVVIGRSDIVGLPVAAMLNDLNATVTICHSKTQNLKQISRNADILVVAIGKSEFIDSEYIKKDSVVIDVGTNKNEEGKLVGDVEYESVKDIVGYITPVPGGVGPMTIASLLLNLFNCYKRNVEGQR